MCGLCLAVGSSDLGVCVQALGAGQRHIAVELNENAGTIIFSNGGPAGTTPGSLPETGGAMALAPWVCTMLAGLAALGTGVALRRRRHLD